MNIAVFAKQTTLHQNHWGMETQNESLLKGLKQKGHSIVVFAPKWNLEESELTHEGIKYIFVDCVYRMGPVFGFFGTYQKNNWINRSYEEFSKIHAHSPFDVVLAQSSTGLGIIRNKDKAKIKVLSISHGTIIGEYLTFIASMELPKDLLALIKNTGFTLKNFFRRQRDFVHGSDKIVAVSNQVKKALIDETFTFEDKIAVINNGIDPTPFFASQKVTDRGTKMLYVGQVIKSKGMEEMVTIFSNPMFKTYQIDIVGSGEFTDKLKQLISKNNLQKNINLVGRVPHSELVEKYYSNKEYGVFVFPTKRYEGFPMALVETLFAGIPCVAYGMGGVSDAVLDSKTGYVVKPGEIEVFKQKLLELLTNQQLRNTFSRAGMAYASTNLTLDKMINQYENLLTGVVK